MNCHIEYIGGESPQKKDIIGKEGYRMIHIDINLKIIRIAIEIEEGFPNKIHRYGNYFVFNRNPF